MIHADNPGTATVRRYRVKDAAVLLGLSTQAIRHRIRRGTLDSEKDEDGIVWVLLAPDTVSADSPQDDSGVSTDGPPDDPPDGSLLELVEVLREQLAAAEERERRSDERERELRRIIAGLVQRVPELPSPDGPQDTPPDSPQDGPRNVRPEERDVPETASPRSDGGTTPEVSEKQQRRSWLHRFFFGP